MRPGAHLSGFANRDCHSSSTVIQFDLSTEEFCAPELARYFAGSATLTMRSGAATVQTHISARELRVLAAAMLEAAKALEGGARAPIPAGESRELVSANSAFGALS